MRKLIIFCIMAISAASFPGVLYSQTRVIAHRGFWNTPGSAQNSVASVKEAARLGVYGCEFDVHVTADGVPVVYHDDEINGTRVEHQSYDQLREFTLSNGEKLPTLREYLSEGVRHPEMKLVLEIKEASTAEKESLAVRKILEVAEEIVPARQIEYISFSLHVVQELLRERPGISVAYLNGDLTPSELKEREIPGMDYELELIRERPEWLPECRELGIYTNVWTVNSEHDMRMLVEWGADFITTDDPVLLQAILAEQE